MEKNNDFMECFNKLVKTVFRSTLEDIVIFIINLRGLVMFALDYIIRTIAKNSFLCD